MERENAKCAKALAASATPALVQWTLIARRAAPAKALVTVGLARAPGKSEGS